MNKKLLKSLIVAGALASSASAQATLNLGGILIDPGFHIEVTSLYENPVTKIGDMLSGYGQVTQINGSSAFCAGGLGTCELTYRFTDYVVSSISPTGVSFTGGKVNFYVGTGSTIDFNPYTSGSSAADIAAATNGLLWLTLTGHDNGGFTLKGAGTQIGSGGNDIGSGGGLLDVNLAGGGVANSNFDSNSQNDLIGGKADFQFSSSFGTGVVPHPGECQATPPILTSCLPGSATLRGVALPEPTSLC